MSYAQNTDVPTDRSRAEIERTLQRYGASKFAYGWDEHGATIMFESQARRVRFVLPLPNPNERRFTHHSRGPRKPEAAQNEYERATRQRWRALALVIKAKLEAVESGITTFEDEFLAHTMLPNGQTVGEWVQPQVVDAYLTGGMPALMPVGHDEDPA
jgi:hypothetical protein